MKTIFYAVTLSLFVVTCAQAAITLPRIYSDNMVLQADRPIVFTGTAPARMRVTVKISLEKGGAGVDAFAAGRHAAESLKTKLNGVEPHVVIITECFAEKADKAKVAKGVASVFGKDKVVGISAYGFYTRDGVADRNAVALLALGGDDIAVRTAFVPK